MGRFIYENTVGESFPVEDRVLAHLELAIAAKFRRGESFALTLTGNELPAGQGQRAFWMHPSVPLQFKYDADRRSIPLNPAWIAEMVATAFSDFGMRIVPEPPPARRRADEIRG